MAIRVMLVDDHEVVRIGLRRLLEFDPELEVVGEAADGEEALRLAFEIRPDIVLLDLRLPGRSGIEACRELRRLVPAPRVIILSSFAERSDVAEAIRAGAAGYLLKQAGGDALRQAIRTVASGEAVLDPELVSGFAYGSRTGADGVLTKREREILDRLVLGKSNREIGRELFLGEGTVRNHLSTIFAKLGVRNRAQAVAWALQKDRSGDGR